MDRRIDVGHHPVDASEMRETFEQFPEILVRNRGDLARRERRDVVVQPLEREAVKVDEVAAELQLTDLLLPVRHVPVAGHPSIEQQQALVQHLATPDDGYVRADPSDLSNRGAYRRLVLASNAVADTKFLEMGFNHGK